MILNYYKYLHTYVHIIISTVFDLGQFIKENVLLLLELLQYFSTSEICENKFVELFQSIGGMFFPMLEIL